jgi:hypothetical protein
MDTNLFNLELIFDPFRHFMNDLGFFHMDNLC